MSNECPTHYPFRGPRGGVARRRSGCVCRRGRGELLIAHGWWLYRDDFVDGFVVTDRSWVAGTPVAWVEWAAAVVALDAGRLPCSRGEAQVVRVAASIADGVPVDLRDALTGLDGDTVPLVARAVARAGGYRDATVTLAEPRA